MCLEKQPDGDFSNDRRESHNGPDWPIYPDHAILRGFASGIEAPSIQLVLFTRERQYRLARRH
jgi:hypothetical protein